MARKKNNIGFFTIYPEDDRVQADLQIFDLLKKDEALSVGDIGGKTGISGDIVAEYINTCVKNDLLKIAASEKGDQVKFNDDYKKILGIGVSGRECILVVMDLRGNMISREHIEIDVLSKWRGKNKDLNMLVREIGNRTKLCGTEFSCAGIALSEKMIESNPKTVDILGKGIADVFKCDVFVSRSTAAAGYGERESGGYAADKDFLYMYSDEGTGIVLKSELIFEADNTSSEKQRAYLRPWDQFDIAGTAKKLVNRGVGTDIVNMVHGDSEKISLEIVLDAAENQDELAEDLVKRSGLALGVRIAYLVNMFNVGTVILGGGIEKNEGGFMQSVKESSKKFLLKGLSENVEIVPGVLGKEASSIGAALLCRRELFM